MLQKKSQQPEEANVNTTVDEAAVKLKWFKTKQDSRKGKQSLIRSVPHSVWPSCAKELLANCALITCPCSC